MKPFGTTTGRFFYFYTMPSPVKFVITLGAIGIFCAKTSPIMSQSILSYYKDNRTPTYEEVIDFYQQADSLSPYMQLMTGGLTDAGLPLHVLVIDAHQEFTPAQARARNKMILLINNGIHPGEPDGIDASLLFIDSLLHHADLQKELENLLICIIPIYNIDGALNRNSTSRVNQNGPESFGFRGNGRNYDLNRDFVKADTRNTIAFTQIFRHWDPDVFIDTHVSNGADYQHVMTLIPTYNKKLAPHQSEYLENYMLKWMYAYMEDAGFPMCPYINEFDKTPDQGISAFLDRPRYSTGYAALYNTIGFMPETHMLKPYPQRVEATLAFFRAVIQSMQINPEFVLNTREIAKLHTLGETELTLDFELDTTRYNTFPFMGYEARYKTSEVSGLERLYYDRNAPYTKDIRVYDFYRSKLEVHVPETYVIPQAWKEIIEKLEANGVIMERLPADTVIQVQYYRIKNYETTEQPYEGHYYHSNIEVEIEHKAESFHKGDILVHTAQEAKKYIVYTLEPQSPDGFFAWGYFDAILMQKEWFSDYVFEDLAAELLRTDPHLKALLEQAKLDDPALAENAWAQLRFVYEHSPYKEPTHKRFPIARILK